MTSRALLFSMLLIVIGLLACCREPETYYDIPASAYPYLPYDSTSTFQLQDSMSRVVNTYTVESHSLKYEFVEDCAECCTNQYAQYYSLTFRGDNPAVGIKIGLSQSGYGGTPSQPVLGIVYSAVAFDIVLDGSDCGMGQAFQCHDSLVVNGLQYTNVLELVPYYSYTTDSLSANRIWYNKTKGLLKFTTLNGQVWEVMP